MPSAESSEISLQISDSDVPESLNTTKENEGHTEETTEKSDEITEETDNPGFGFKISAIASMNATSENLEEMEISEEANKADSVEETPEPPNVAKDVFTTSLEEPTKDDLENSKGAPEVEADNVDTEKSKDLAGDDEASK